MRAGAFLFAVAVVAAGCSSLGPPLQGARTGDKILRATEPMTFAEVARIAWGDSTLASSAAALAGMQPEETVAKGTVLVLPTRERLSARLREAREFAVANGGGAERKRPVASPPAPSAGKRTEAAALYGRGLKAAQEDRDDDALRDWEKAWQLDPSLPGLMESLEAEYRVRGLEAFSAGDLSAARELWEKALKIDPRDETTLGYLQRVREQQERSDQLLKPGGTR